MLKVRIGLKDKLLRLFVSLSD